MPLHPPPPSTFSETVDAWAQTVQTVLDLGRTIRPDDAGLATDCPGWTVQDQIAHVVSLEASVAGESVPDRDVSGLEHVRGEFATTVEKYLDSRRGRALEDLLDELEWRLGERLEVYRAEGVTGEEDVVGLRGPSTLRELLGVRTFDVWMHEQDLREALERPGGLDTAAAATSVDRVFGSLGWVVARRAAVPAGNAVVLDLTGPTVGRAGVRVEEQDGKTVGVPLFSGGGEEHDDVVTTSLSMSTRVAMRLAGGRRRPEDLPVTVSGDEDVAAAVLTALSITP